MQKDELLSMERIKYAFALFDLDGNGYIDKKEIEAAFGWT